MKNINQKLLKEELTYSPETGIFIRNKSSGGKLAGCNAGGIHSEGYIYISLRGKRYFAHRLAWLYMTGENPSQLIDHINGNRSDNRFENLRLATKSQNGRNAKVRKDSTSGIKGVRFERNLNKWTASIFHGKKRIHLGVFESSDLAYQARESAAKRLHGDFYHA